MDDGKTVETEPRLESKRVAKKQKVKPPTDPFTVECTCRSDGTCIGHFTISQINTFRTDLAHRSKTERKQWLVEQLRSRSVGKQKHLPYEVQGKKLCRHGFMALYGLKKHHLDAARKTVDSGHGSLVVHGNQVSSVQAARGAMKTAIQGTALAELTDEKEVIQTMQVVTFVFMSLSIAFNRLKMRTSCTELNAFLHPTRERLFTSCVVACGLYMVM